MKKYILIFFAVGTISLLQADEFTNLRSRLARLEFKDPAKKVENPIFLYPTVGPWLEQQKSYVNQLVAFIGDEGVRRTDDSAQRKKDVETLKRITQHILDALVKSGAYLEKLVKSKLLGEREREIADFKEKGMVARAVLPVTFDPTQIDMLNKIFRAFVADDFTLQGIIERSQEAWDRCMLGDCKKKFTLLQEAAKKVQETIRHIQYGLETYFYNR